MPVLEYDFRVTGAQNVTRAIAGIENRVVQMNSRVSRAAGIRSGGGVNTIRQAETEGRKLLREQQRQHDYWHRARLNQARQRHREEVSQVRRVEAERLRTLKREARARSDFVRNTIGGGFSGGASRAMGATRAVGGAGLALTGIAGAGLAASAVSQATRLDEMVRRISIMGRAKGDAGISPASIQHQVETTALSRGLNPEALAAGLGAAVEKTGDLKRALKDLDTVAVASQATGADASEMFLLQADALGKFGVNAEEAFAVLNQQGKKGSFALASMARLAPRTFAAASAFGFKGSSGLRDIGGLLQIARDVTGSDEQAAFATEAMLRQMTAKADDIQSGKAFGGKKVEVFEGGDPTKGARNFRDLLGDVMVASGGNAIQMQEVFGEEGIRLMRPFLTKFRDAGGGEDGRKAVAGLISNAADVPADFAEIQRDAADAMKSTSVQLEILNTKLKQAVASELMPELMRLIPIIGELVPVVGRITRAFVALAEFFAGHPFIGLAGILAAALTVEIGKAQLKKVFENAMSRSMGIDPKTGEIAVDADGQPKSGKMGKKILGGRATVGGALAAAGAGAMLGISIGTAILTAGVVNFKQEEGELANAGAALNLVRSMNPEQAEEARKILNQERKRLNEIKEGGVISNLFGRGAAESLGAENASTLATQESNVEELTKLVATLEAQKSAADKQIAAADKLDAAADKLSASNPNRTDQPSGVKPGS